MLFQSNNNSFQEQSWENRQEAHIEMVWAGQGGGNTIRKPSSCCSASLLLKIFSALNSLTVGAQPQECSELSPVLAPGLPVLSKTLQRDRGLKSHTPCKKKSHQTKCHSWQRWGVEHIRFGKKGAQVPGPALAALPCSLCYSLPRTDAPLQFLSHLVTWAGFPHQHAKYFTVRGRWC